MLEKLSQEQEILMYATRNEYLKKFFSLPKLNKKKATEYIKWLYQFSNLKEPNVLFVDSPMACQVACNILNMGTQVESQVLNQVLNQVWNQIWNQVLNQVESQVLNQVLNQVESQVESQVWNQVGNQVRSQVGNQVRDQVGNQVRSQVWNQVRDQVWNQVWSQVWNQVKDQVRDQVGNQVKDQNLEYFNFGYYADYSDFGWISFYDFFTKIGILNDEKFNQYKKLVDTGIFMTIQTENYCIVSAMPTKLLREGEKLHNPDGYAIEFKDGYGQHYLYGIYFEPELFEKIKTMTAKDVVKIKNIEQRMALLKLFGAEKILNELGADLIDKSERGNELYSITGLTDKTEKILKYECPSTGRVYTKFVEPRFEKADEAQAWSHHFTIEEYSKLKIEA